MGENNQLTENDKSRRSGFPKIPFADTLKFLIRQIEEQTFLFVIAIAILLVAILAATSEIGSAELRLIILVIAILAFVVIVGYYLLEGRKQSAEKQVLPSDSPLSGLAFIDDTTINTVVNDLKSKHQIRGKNLSPKELLESLNILFDRMTFRHETLYHCATQSWNERLHIAYQTQEILKAYQINMRDFGSDEQKALYQELISCMDKYCMTMEANLFEQIVDEGQIRKYIGTSEFNSYLPKMRKFVVEDGELQDMPHSWDEGRKMACKAMDSLMLTLG